MSEALTILNRLMETIQTRAQERPAGSYTTKLIEGGVGKIGKKVIEEAAEVVEAAAEEGAEGKEHFTYEVGDLLYHTMVMMAWRGVTLDDVAAELGRREGIGGLVEKASRTQPGDNPA
ncbi:Phosphoribosyl-ATP pyrophosphatase [Rosistilla carotiformis]|uniref:Phosphoribosyl-ATP pyrophosphatase n=1 Tax=Rosistilla carotiformis TaxID=2528017 RepID=A0A518JV84_9BACT|nr:phosphoribosyl-ATP diphosphatase [Rosistilla carotiformis]QDV69455.1 Phosphoribosyl-ATP pyrophosphatase [Rosistilla carotiformis]